jgi:type III secretion protein L
MPFSTVVHVSQPDLSIRGKVIRADEWRLAGEASELLLIANTVRSQAEQAALLLREQAKQQGFQQGFAEGKAQVASSLARLAQSEVTRLEQHEQRVTQLALAVVERLLGQLKPAELITELVREAISSAIAEQFISIRVAPDAKAELEAQIQQFRLIHPAVMNIEVQADPALDIGACVICTESGEVRGHLFQQFEAIKQALMNARTQSD